MKWIGSQPLSLKNVEVKDQFWNQEMELVRTEVIPYQWEILNDRVKDAAPSFCMRNFKIAGRMMKEKREKGADFVEPKYTFRGFEALPEDMENWDEDKFYGFVFQDSDFSKWIEAVAYSLMEHSDAELEKTADAAIDVVCAAQQDNGYLDTYYIINGMDKIFTNLRDHHELYCFGHLTEGAVAYYQATGKDKLLKAAMRFADFIDSYFGPEEDKCKGYPGHEIAEMALVRLYEVTGEKRYLDLSCHFIEERGKRPYYWDAEQKERPAKEDEERYFYHQAHRPVKEQDEATGHAVRAMYLYSGMADVARIKEDEKMYEACKRLWDSTVQQKMYITGAVGATSLGEAFSFPFDLPNDLAYAETCASIGLIFFARRMLQIEANAEYADVMELALYNTVLAGMALDGKSFFYVNPLEVWPEACHKDERKFHVKPVRQKWFGCACCPPNIARLLSSITSYAYTETEDTLYMHLYIGGAVKKQVNGKEAAFEVTSAFPWNGNVSVSYTGEDTHMTLAIRIPGWSRNNLDIRLEGIESRVENGYLYLTGDWKKGMGFTVDFGMKVCLMRSADEVRENMGKVAIQKGPVVYCMEEVDNGAQLQNLELDPSAALEECKVEVAGRMYPAVRTKGLRRKVQEQALLYQEYTGAVEKEEVELQFLPYYLWANRGENEMQVWVRVKE